MKRILGLSALLASLLSVALGSATAATAESRRDIGAASNCVAAMCMWNGAVNTDPIYVLRTEDSDFHNNSYPGGGTWGDRMSSYHNVSGRTYCFYVDTGFRGTPFRVAHGRWGNFPDAYNNRISSAKPC